VIAPIPPSPKARADSIAKALAASKKKVKRLAKVH
jgi:hypothetical protein